MTNSAYGTSLQKLNTESIEKLHFTRNLSWSLWVDLKPGITSSSWDDKNDESLTYSALLYGFICSIRKYKILVFVRGDISKSTGVNIQMNDGWMWPLHFQGPGCLCSFTSTVYFFCELSCLMCLNMQNQQFGPLKSLNTWCFIQGEV